MMVAPYGEKETVLTVDGPLVSASYVEMTQEVMEAFGAEVRADRALGVYQVSAKVRYVPRDYRVEADASSATYGCAAAAIAGGEVLVPGLSLTSHQPDVAFVSILRKMGCAVESSGGGIRVRGGGTLHGVDAEMGDCPDAVPTLASVAAFATGPTRIRNVEHLRHKESDRLSAIADELRKIGADVVVDEGGMRIDPRPLRGGLMQTYGDHRLAMSFSLIGLRVPGIVIENPACVVKSFPGYWEEFEGLRRQS
jgi:3-phosphoshikimate 1-carboxyvinyltransferase